MAHFSPVNGAFPHKNQIDRTCPVKPLGDGGDYAKTYQRGCVLFVNEDGKFESATSGGGGKNVKGPLYFCLQDYSDTQAAMAGGPLGTGKGRDVAFGQSGVHTDGIDAASWVAGKDMPNHDAAAYGQPAVTGLSFQEGGNYETDVFKKDATYKIGDPLKVVDGEFQPGSAEDCVAYVYAAPFRRYVNDAVSRDGWSTGAYRSVIRVSVK